jgi:hypothetical protein
MNLASVDVKGYIVQGLRGVEALGDSFSTQQDSGHLGEVRWLGWRANVLGLPSCREVGIKTDNQLSIGGEMLSLGRVRIPSRRGPA